MATQRAIEATPETHAASETPPAPAYFLPLFSLCRRELVLLFLALAPLLGLRLGAAALGGIAAVLFLVSLGMTATGFLFAWRADSIQGFHAVMNLLLFPMWLLSGAFFPPSGAPVWLRAVMY